MKTSHLPPYLRQQAPQTIDGRSGAPTEETDMTTQTTTKTTLITRRSVLRIDWQWRAEWRALSASQIRELPRLSPAQALSVHAPAWARGGASPGGKGAGYDLYHRGRRLDWDGGDQGSLHTALWVLARGLINELEWPYAEEDTTDEA